MKKYLITIAILVTILIASTNMYAAGGKVKNPWQPASADECSVFLPEGLDEDKCEVVSVTQSGIAYLCSGIPAYCPSSVESNNSDKKED